MILKAFISYSSKQFDLSLEIKGVLEGLNIDSFVAGDDLRISSDWKKSITTNLLDCEIFVPLISKEFKNSEWCSQELGIAYVQKMVVIPISIDQTKPYGFINHIQSKSIATGSVEMILCEGLLVNGITEGAMGLVNSLKKSGNYNYSDLALRTFEPFFESISIEIVNEIAQVSINNRQVREAGECSMILLPKLLNTRGSEIRPDLRSELERLIKKR